MIFIFVLLSRGEQHPQCAIRVVEAFSSTIPAMMHSAHVDVAIVTDPGRVEAWVELWSRTYDEDTDAVERQQKGLSSGRVPRLRYAPAREQPALFINGLIREAYREALGEAPPAARSAFG